MNIERALAIPGWMEERELIWLANAATRYQRIAEIGCWMGRSTRALADNLVTGTIYAIDHWQGSEEHQPQLADKPKGWLYGQFCANLADHILDGRVKPIGLSSLDASKLVLSYNLLDMVFIDGAHDYEAVKADILAWKPLVRVGGMLCGHDRGYAPVARAIAETLGPVGGETDIWEYTV
jgi:predicted O-methyltransferase YrrM